MISNLFSLIYMDLIQENTPATTEKRNVEDGPVEYAEAESEKVTVERELVSQAEEEDMEALLGTQVFSFLSLLLVQC